MKTDACSSDQNKLDVKNAVEFEDYLPYREKVVFNHGEVEKSIFITLV